jgi:hypothetical protein
MLVVQPWVSAALLHVFTQPQQLHHHGCHFHQVRETVFCESHGRQALAPFEIQE